MATFPLVLVTLRQGKLATFVLDVTRNSSIAEIIQRLRQQLSLRVVHLYCTSDLRTYRALLPIKDLSYYMSRQPKIIMWDLDGVLRDNFPYLHIDLPAANVMADNFRNFQITTSKQKYRLNIFYDRRWHAPFFLQPTALLLLNNNSNRTYYSFKAEEDWLVQFDAITDHYTEDVRMQAQRSYAKYAPVEYWHLHEKELTTQADKTTNIDTSAYRSKLRDFIWQEAPWATRFRPSWVKFLLESLYPTTEGLAYLDISAGWGDRLMAAMLLHMSYLGFDPNYNLKQGHDAMIAQFGHRAATSNSTGNSSTLAASSSTGSSSTSSNITQQVIYQPFELAMAEMNIVEEYDVVLSSPPFFNFELYERDNSEQSVDSYANYAEWLEKFLFVSLKLAWRALKRKCYMLIHLADSRELAMTNRMNTYISELPGAQYYGVIGLGGGYGKYRPVWVWHKE